MISAFENLEGGTIQADALTDLSYEAFEVCGFNRETVENKKKKNTFYRDLFRQYLVLFS